MCASLKKCLSSASVLARGGQIDMEDLPLAVRTAPKRPQAAPDPKRRAELVALLRDHGGNVTGVARALGKARAQVQRWLRRYRIDPVVYRR